MHAVRCPLQLGLILTLFAICAHAGVPSASAPAAADLQKSFPEIRRLLSSSDFAQREAGQTLLDALSPSDLVALRTLAKIENDPEVQARLVNRIDALELHILTNSPGLSLHVENGTFQDVRDRFNTQLGTGVQIISFGANGLIAGGERIMPKPLNLHADHRPF